MGLVYKQLTKQIVRNSVFVALLFLLTILTSLSFFFVKFSIDGNRTVLDSLPSLTENQELYKNALNSNTSLAYTFLVSLTGMTSFVLIMFFYRFFRSNKKLIGCLKSLGFKDKVLRYYFMIFVTVLSAMGAVLGLLGGYFLSSVLIGANTRTYLVTGLIKGVSISSLIFGLGVTIAVFCLVTYFCYYFVCGKEPGVLIAGNQNNNKFSISLRIANLVADSIPVKNKFPLRIALRKPLAVVLIIIAVMGFSVCMILGYSLNISSQKIYDSQTIGHNYEYDTHYLEYHTEPVPVGAMAYLDSPVELNVDGYNIQQTMIGLYNLNGVYELQDVDDIILPVPDTGSIYINPGLKEVYGVGVSDTLNIKMAGTSYSFTVVGIAKNAKSDSIYVDSSELSSMLKIPSESYNGILSMEEATGGGTAITKSQRIDNLKRNAVSNNTSGVINQVIGGAVGCILIFLALFVNFQDNTHDMLILHIIGYRVKVIKKLLIDVYMPIVWSAYILTIVPNIIIARTVQKSLSISTQDYMPFGTNILVVLLIFIILNLIYWLVKTVFALRIKSTITKEEISDYTYAT